MNQDKWEKELWEFVKLLIGYCLSAFSLSLIGLSFLVPVYFVSKLIFR